MLVSGPYLVRSAAFSPDDCTLQLTGDIDNTTTIAVFAPNNVASLEWNGKVVQTSRTEYGASTATLNGPDVGAINLPALTDWKAHDSLPERWPDYDDSGIAWVGKLNLLLSAPGPFPMTHLSIY